MPLASDAAQQLRMRINDQPKRRVATLLGDGTAATYELGAQVGGIVTAGGAGYGPSAYVPQGGTAWSATGAAFGYSDGTVQFSGVISANSAFQVVWYDAVFSDEEVSYLTGLYPGNVERQHFEAVNTLMMDAYKRAAWGGGGVTYDDSKTFANLAQTRAILFSAMTVEQGPAGGFESWSDAQQDYVSSDSQRWW